MQTFLVCRCSLPGKPSVSLTSCLVSEEAGLAGHQQSLPFDCPRHHTSQQEESQILLGTSFVP